jgi:hypothetical protein
MNVSPHQLLRAYLSDLVVDIRCAERDSSDKNPLLDYADRCRAEVRLLFRSRHKPMDFRYGRPTLARAQSKSDRWS